MFVDEAFIEECDNVRKMKEQINGEEKEREGKYL